MSLPRTAVDLVPGDIDGLLAAAATHSDLAGKVRETKLQLASVVEGSTAYWSGLASTAFRAAGGAQATQLQEVVPLAEDAAEAYQTLGTALQALRAEAADVLTASERLGLPGADLTGNPIAVVQHIVSEPADTIAIVRLLAAIVAVRVRVGDAHNAFVVAIARTTTLLSDRAEDRRGPDGLGGQRIRDDGLTRRGDPGSDHLDNDWAGRAILERYLLGGGDWTIDDDEAWSDYMMDNEGLRLDMAGRNGAAALDALNRYLTSGQRSGSFDAEFAQSIENGEGIVGYQYLHGTNADAGGFEHSGSTYVTPRPDGTYEVRMDVSYEWNDVIDPNPQYSTDRWKSQLAEILTLGQADPYDIHIGWQEPTTVILDAQGNVVSMEGYPG